MSQNVKTEISYTNNLLKDDKNSLNYENFFGFKFLPLNIIIIFEVLVL